jgi:heme exporter protein D
MATAPQQKVKFRDRLKQIGMVFSFTAKRDRLFVPLALVGVLVPLAATGIAIALGASWSWLAVGVLAAVLAIMIVLNLRSNKAMMSEMAGQPGAAASLIENMRGDWRVTPAVQYTGQFDMVHLVIGRPGVILIGEGNPQKVRQLLGQEKRRLSKVIGSADMRDFIVGDDEGLVPLKSLRNTLMRLPRTISGKDVNALDKRLKALTARPQMPKGQVPKNMRPPKGAFRAMRGR